MPIFQGIPIAQKWLIIQSRLLVHNTQNVRLNIGFYLELSLKIIIFLKKHIRKCKIYWKKSGPHKKCKKKCFGSIYTGSWFFSLTMRCHEIFLAHHTGSWNIFGSPYGVMNFFWLTIRGREIFWPLCKIRPAPVSHIFSDRSLNYLDYLSLSCSNVGRI